MAQHFLPVDEYAHLKVKFRFENYLGNGESYTINFTLDDGKTWHQVERFKNVWHGKKNPNDEWGVQLVFIDEINAKLETWKKRIVSYSDFYEEFVAQSVRDYQHSLEMYNEFMKRHFPKVINGF